MDGLPQSVTAKFAITMLRLGGNFSLILQDGQQQSALAKVMRFVHISNIFD